MLISFIKQTPNWHEETTKDGYIIRYYYPHWALYPLFALCGVGWAFINCCSYPMFVELASGSNVGKYTGLYYAASMLAQTLTPVCAGLLILKAGKWDILFVYSTIVMAAALIVFVFVDNVKAQNVKIKKGLEALDQD